MATLLAKELPTTEKGKHIHLLCQLLEEAYDLCDRKEYVWPDKIGKALSFMSLLVAVAAASVKSTPAWMLPRKILSKFGFAFHLILEGVWNPELEEDMKGL